jgi:flagellin
MSLSIQTNVNSLVAQENLSSNSIFQSQTIQRLTSGYRINSSADDAAGLAVANKFRSDTAELTQGVRNANDGISQLQIIDGGLTNISKMLDRLKTLATQSASTTFTGDRTTLNNEFQSLLGEINRQAADIKLDSTGTFKSKMSVYIGGGNQLNSVNTNAQVSVDLSSSAVDATSLGIGTANVLGGGVGFSGNGATKSLNDPGSTFTAQTGGFDINYIDSNGRAATVNVNYTTGDTGAQVVTELNNKIDKAVGVTAQIGSNGQLQFFGSGKFTVSTTNTAGGVVTAGSASIVNTGNNHIESTAFANFVTGDGTAGSDALTFTDAKNNKTLTYTLDGTNATTVGDAVDTLNTQFKTSGLAITALVVNGQVSFQSAGDFRIDTVHTPGTPGATSGGTGQLFATGGQSATPLDSATTSTGSGLAAVDAIVSANAKLGLVQGRVGTGENQLSYAIKLAQSQITNFSSAQAQIRDADVATEAANLSKAQVLQQASIAAMAQANSAPQAVLTLLRG